MVQISNTFQPSNPLLSTVAAFHGKHLTIAVFLFHSSAIGGPSRDTVQLSYFKTYRSKMCLITSQFLTVEVSWLRLKSGARTCRNLGSVFGLYDLDFHRQFCNHFATEFELRNFLFQDCSKFPHFHTFLPPRYTGEMYFRVSFKRLITILSIF